RALRQIRAAAEAEPLDRGYQAYQAALRDVRPLYEEANAIKTVGVEPHPDLYRRLADLRERMGLRDEARAWHRLALDEQPDDPGRRAGFGRLSTANTPAGPLDDPPPIRHAGEPHQGPATPRH